MDRHAAEWVMLLLGVTSAVLLVTYGLTAAGGNAETDPVFWLFALAFLVYIGWDIGRHLKGLRTRSQRLEGRNP